jgi:hypothetical protein
MRFAARPLALILLTSLVACSGGGGSTPGPAPGSSAKPAGKPAQLAVSIHIPATLAGTSSSSRRVAAGSRANPKFISPSSNGLAIQLYPANSYVAGSAPSSQPTYEADFDISGANTTPGATCTADTMGGRSCSTTITEPSGTYDFVISTYASAPTSGTSGFGTAPSLDSGFAGTQTLSSTQPTTIAATLGGTVTAVKLSVAQTFAAAGGAAVPVGVTPFDAAGEVIVSSTDYSAPITLGISSSAGFANGPYLHVGTATSTQITSANPNDAISLVYSGETPARAGETITISATPTGGVKVTTTTAPFYTTGSPAQAVTTTQPVFEISPTSGTQETITLTEGSTYGGPLKIVADPASPCVSSGSSTASASSPLLFNNNGTETTTPPTLVATNGVATLAVQTAGFTTPGGGCSYDVSDTSGTIVPFTISAISYVPCHPASNLYVNFDASESATGDQGLVEYALPLTANSTPTQLENAGQTVWLSFDEACTAYVTFYTAGVHYFQSPYTGAASQTVSVSGDPYGAIVDNYQHLFVDQSSSNAVVELDVTSGALINTLSVAGPYSIAFDSKANLYVGGSQGITEFAPPYTQSTLVRTILTNVDVQGIAFGATDTLFAVGNNSLTVIAPPYGAGNVMATNTDPSFSTPLGLAVDANGNVYVPNYNGNTITEFQSPYTATPVVTLSVPGALPDADAIGP